VNRGFHAPLGAHFVLVGLPGAGKSTVGIALSHRLRWPFLDFDIEISRRAGKTVAEIFAHEGEPGFRKREMDLTRELVGTRPQVLSPGGGWVVNEGAVALLRPPSRIIHLRVSPEFALARIQRSRTVRPLLTSPDPLAVMRRLWEERGGLYNQADFVVDAENLDTKRVTDIVVDLAARDASGLG
jgi:shikimate kinase